MKKCLKVWLCALALMIASAGSMAVAQEASPVSPALLQKILKYVDKIGSKETFPAPVAQELGVSDDPKKDLPITVIRTNDHKVYFCRSDLDANDYIIWVRAPDNASSWMFLTHPDFKPVSGLLLHINDFPQRQDLSSPKVAGVYKDALAALINDVSTSPAP
jgi:hypothetical protein